MSDASISATVRDSGLVIVSLAGELDSHTTQFIEPDFGRALANRTVKAIIDLTAVSFLTSSALAMFLSYAKTMKSAGGELAIAGAADGVLAIFQQSGFDTIFHMSPTLDEAIAALER